MLDEDAQDALEVAPVHDQRPVQTLGANRAGEALGDRVRCRRTYRRLANRDAFAAEDGVEVACELAVAVADQETQRRWALAERPGELAGLLGDPDAARIGGAAGEVDTPSVELDEEEHVQPLQRDGVDGEEVNRRSVVVRCGRPA
jgi:hypothetical protein